MSIWKGLTAAAPFVRALAIQGSAGGAASVYTVVSTTVPGLNDRACCQNGQNATVTATGAV